MDKKKDLGEFFPYINGRYVNPYMPKEKDPTIRKKHKEKEKTNDIFCRYSTSYRNNY